MLYTDLEDILGKVRASLEIDDLAGAVAAIEALRAPDQADLFHELEDQHQTALLPRLDPEDSADILEELEDEDAARLVATLPRAAAVRILNEMEPDEAADLLGEMEPAHAHRLVDELEDPAEVRPLLLHPEDTAGGLMTSEFLALGRRMSVADALAALRTWKPDAEDIHEVYAVDRLGRLVGMIGMRQLLMQEPAALLSLGYAGYFLVTQVGRRAGSLWRFSWGIYAISAIMLFAFNLITGVPVAAYPIKTFLVFIAIGIFCQAIGYTSIVYALGHLPASIVSPTMVAQIVLTSLLAIPLTGESISIIQIIGGVIVIAGILLVNLSRAKHPDVTASNTTQNTLSTSD